MQSIAPAAPTAEDAPRAGQRRGPWLLALAAALAVPGAPGLLAEPTSSGWNPAAVAGSRAGAGRPSEDVASSAAAAEAERLVYLLEYIGVDYGHAVRDGAILDDFEYGEMLEFARVLLENTPALLAAGAAADVEGELGALLDLVLARAPDAEVRAHTSVLVRRLIDETRVEAVPATTPNLKRGRRLFAANCAPCHGEAGGGDGRAAPGMEPPPTSFREARMNRVSPHQVFGATRFGVEGTAMPAFGDGLPRRAAWDVSFYVMTLRDGFDPRRADAPLDVSLQELALSADYELLQRATSAGKPVAPAHLDYLRRHPPRP